MQGDHVCVDLLVCAKAGVHVWTQMDSGRWGVGGGGWGEAEGEGWACCFCFQWSGSPGPPCLACLVQSPLAIA